MAKTAAKPKVEKKTMKKRSKPSTYKLYISKVLKQVRPQVRISKKSMLIVNNFVSDTFDRLATEAGKLCKLTKRNTLSGRDMQSAIRLVLPGDLSRHACSEAVKAMAKFSQA